MARYLARIINAVGYKPSDARTVSEKLRKILGSAEAIGNLRVSSKALEFDLFAKDPLELESRRSTLESKIGKILTLKLLDQVTSQAGQKLEILREGVQLFNEERFWESHEVLERIWHPSKGVERDIIQGMILTAAALVHAQKNRTETSLNMLRKAMDKLGTTDDYEGVDLRRVKENIEDILKTRHPQSFRIEL